MWISKCIQNNHWVLVAPKGRKVLLCGNGGSADDTQHLAAEFTGCFYKNGKSLYAEALYYNTSYLTAVANDFSYEDIYSRLVKAEGKEGDALMAFSISWNSMNIIKARTSQRSKNVYDRIYRRFWRSATINLPIPNQYPLKRHAPNSGGLSASRPFDM